VADRLRELEAGLQVRIEAISTTGDRVLDCACGAGYGSALLAQTGARVTGADTSRAAARYARVRYGETMGAQSCRPRDLPAPSIGSRAQHLHFICADAASLPHPDDTFDVVVSFETLGRLSDEGAYVAEMSRVLKPQGLFIVSAPWQPWVGENWPSDVRAYTRPQFETLLRERFFVRDFVPQMDGLVNWRLPLGNRMIAMCENRKRGALTIAPGRWSRLRPQVSVIMCAWNAGAYLEEALQSIFDQTFQDFEFLVVDNNSTDGTRERLRALHDQGKLRLIPLDENLGVSRGLLVALAHSRGRFIARMDADDRSQPQRLARQVEYLLAHPEVYVLATRTALIDSEGKDTGRHFDADIASSYEEICRTLQEHCPMAHGSVMLRRELLREVGTYDLDYDEAEDYEYWTRIYRHRAMEVLPEVLFEHRVHERQATQERLRTVEAWAKCARLANWWRGEGKERRGQE
jgi:SAM-dependent methyltransferase